VYDGVDKSLLYRAVRETRQITENLMRELYPGWDWEKKTRHHSAHDEKNIIRKPEDVTLEQVLEIFFTHESFTTPLWKMIKGRANLGAKNEVVEADLIPFLMVFCCLMFYKCTISEFYSDAEGMFKRYPMSQGLSERKFRGIISAFKSQHDRNTRTKLNNFLKVQLFYLSQPGAWCLSTTTSSACVLSCVHWRGLCGKGTRRVGVLVPFSTWQCRN